MFDNLNGYKLNDSALAGEFIKKTCPGVDMSKWKYNGVKTFENDPYPDDHIWYSYIDERGQERLVLSTKWVPINWAAEAYRI